MKSKDRLLRGGLIGCGFFARNHMNAWRDLPGVDIVAVCDQAELRATEMASSFDVDRSYRDAAAMLREEELDFVDIVTTVMSHRPLVELVSARGIATICQKPFAETMEDAAAMVSAAKLAGVPLLVHENFRWQRPFVEIARRIQEGLLGRINFVRLSFRHRFDSYKVQPYLAEVERFAIMDVGLHLFDLARKLAGEVETVHCRTQRLNPIVKGEDAFYASLSHRGGAVSIIDASFFSRIEPEPFPQTIAWIEGDDATLELAPDYQLHIHRDGKRETVNVEAPVPAWGEKPWHVVQDSVRAFQSHFIDVLHGRSEPQPSGLDNLDTLAVALAAYESAERGQVVDTRSWREKANVIA